MKAHWLIPVAFALVACRTTTTFKIPPGTQLEVYERPVEAGPDGAYTTAPFFWSAAGGIPYRVLKGNEVVDEGKLSSKFRVVSIFWPPAAAIYWPMGFRFPEYDLTNPDPAKGVRSSRKTN